MKSLHPMVHAGILSKRTKDHDEIMKKYNICNIDLVQL